VHWCAGVGLGLITCGGSGGEVVYLVEVGSQPNRWHVGGEGMIFGVGGWVEEAEHEAAVVRNESKGIQARGIGGLERESPNFVGTWRCRERNGGVRRGKRNELREGFCCLHYWK